MNVIEEIKRINQLELEKGIVNTSASWHQKYNQSAWVYCGNLPTQLSEGDVICIMSQYGEVEDLNLVREEDSGKSKGFCFCKYEDQGSTVLAVDNLTGAKILGRSIRVDHVEQYRLPKELLEKEEAERNLGAGHAYDGVDLKNHYNIHQGQDLFGGPPPAGDGRNVENDEERRLAKQKRKEERDLQRREREKRREEKEERKREQRAQQMRSGHEEEDDRGESKSERKSERDRVKGEVREHKKHDRKEDRTEKNKRRRNDDKREGDNRQGRTSHRKRSAREDDTDDEREQRKSRHDSD